MSFDSVSAGVGRRLKTVVPYIKYIRSFVRKLNTFGNSALVGCISRDGLQNLKKVL